jgi:uncharacterized ferritin-like protein (DUF455 family)
MEDKIQTLYEHAHGGLMARNASRKGEIIGDMILLYGNILHCGGRDAADLLQPEGPPVSPARIEQPGQPDLLRMVHPRDLNQRKPGTREGRAIFLHAIAHIEFNAINLALDAIYRFRNLPSDYYRDWLSVAEEETQHHHLVIERLSELGYKYGDFPVHNGLWDIARRTDSDLISRLAMVPCVFEARGLDVAPPMIKKLIAVGDPKSAEILQLILDQEVAHVAIGLRWYRYACGQQGVDPLDRFIELIGEYLPGRPQGPFNFHHRRLAGFSSEWMNRLESLRRN